MFRPQNHFCRTKEPGVQRVPGHIFLQNLSFLIRTIPSVLEFRNRSPAQPLSRVMDYTIGRDFHPATKTFNIQLYQVFAVRFAAYLYYTYIYPVCKGYFQKKLSFSATVTFELKKHPDYDTVKPYKTTGKQGDISFLWQKRIHAIHAARS